jgi:hypothetical protein
MTNNFRGFDISETKAGLTINLCGIREVHLLLSILLFTKFPRSFDFDAITLLSPYVNQLIEACTTKLDNDPDEQSRRENYNSPPATFKKEDEFSQAVMKAIDIYIFETGCDYTERDSLLRKAFLPHKVDGFT